MLQYAGKQKAAPADMLHLEAQAGPQGVAASLASPNLTADLTAMPKKSHPCWHLISCVSSPKMKLLPACEQDIQKLLYMQAAVHAFLGRAHGLLAANQCNQARCMQRLCRLRQHSGSVDIPVPAMVACTCRSAPFSVLIAACYCCICSLILPLALQRGASCEVHSVLHGMMALQPWCQRANLWKQMLLKKVTVFAQAA